MTLSKLSSQDLVNNVLCQLGGVVVPDTAWALYAMENLPTTEGTVARSNAYGFTAFMAVSRLSKTFDSITLNSLPPPQKIWIHSERLDDVPDVDPEDPRPWLSRVWAKRCHNVQASRESHI